VNDLNKLSDEDLDKVAAEELMERTSCISSTIGMVYFNCDKDGNFIDQLHNFKPTKCHNLAQDLIDKVNSPEFAELLFKVVSTPLGYNAQVLLSLNMISECILTASPRQKTIAAIIQRRTEK